MSGPPSDWMPELDATIGDDEIRGFLRSRNLDPHEQPYFCTLAVAEHWSLPQQVADDLVRNL